MQIAKWLIAGAIGVSLVTAPTLAAAQGSGATASTATAASNLHAIRSATKVGKSEKLGGGALAVLLLAAGGAVAAAIIAASNDDDLKFGEIPDSR